MCLDFYHYAIGTLPFGVRRGQSCGNMWSNSWMFGLPTGLGNGPVPHVSPRAAAGMVPFIEGIDPCPRWPVDSSACSCRWRRGCN